MAAFFAGAFLAAFFAGAFLAAFLDADFLAEVFFAEVFFAGAFLAVDFRAGAFLAADFFVVDLRDEEAFFFATLGGPEPFNRPGRVEFDHTRLTRSGRIPGRLRWSDGNERATIPQMT